MAAFTQLRLARACVADLRLPWERRYEPARLRPMRVHRAVSALLAHVGTPAEPPKPCGRSPGRPKGRLSGRAERYPALKKSAGVCAESDHEEFWDGVKPIPKLLVVKTQA